MARTAQVRDAGGYADASGGEDWVLGVSLAFRGPVVISERIGLIYRLGGASLWRANRSGLGLTSAARRWSVSGFEATARCRAGRAWRFPSWRCCSCS